MLQSNINKLQVFRDQIMEELPYSVQPNNTTKDILIVVHDQLPYLKNCIESIQNSTENYNLLIYDNASNEDVYDYISSLDKVSVYFRSPTNDGFIKPNNYLAKLSKSPFMILLNSDTEVRPGWDLALINFLYIHPEVAQVGYSGGKLNPDGLGDKQAVFGNNIDYVCGWCFAISKDTYRKYGLFDEENLEFAYGEDSDFSLRLVEDRNKIYALHMDLVNHYGNKTINQVHLELGDYIKGTFERNHQYICNRWQRNIKKDSYGKKEKRRFL